MEVMTKMYVNPFWFGFGCGVASVIILIILLAIIYGSKGGQK